MMIAVDMILSTREFKASLLEPLKPSMLTVQNIDSNLRVDTTNGLVDKARYSFNKYSKADEHRGDKERHKGIHSVKHIKGA